MQSMNRRSFVKASAGVAALAAIAPVAALAADGSAAKDSKAASSASEAPIQAKPGEIQIFAANSLEKALPEVQALYSEANPGVTFADTQFKASGDLVEQIKAGAMPDILITASKGTMDTAEEGELIDVDTRINMFNNDLVIVRAEGSDIEISAIEDVAGEGIEQIAIGDAATVPAGKYANQALYSVGLYSDESGADGEYDESIADKVNLADKVGTAAKYVSTGDCQVGFVYSSDVFRYDGIEIAYTTPVDSHKTIVYPGAVCTDAVNAETAADFLDFCMTDPDALKVWSQFGFEVADE